MRSHGAGTLRAEHTGTTVESDQAATKYFGATPDRDLTPLAE